MKFILSIILLLFITAFIFSETTVQVFPVGKKQSSGVYVKKGDKLTITVSGQWSLWDKYKPVNGDGHPLNVNEYGNWGVLLGKIGSGKIFTIGNGSEITSDDEGVLFLFPNKDKYLIDSPTGNLDVTIDGGTAIDDFVNEISTAANKFSFDPQKGTLVTNLYFKEGDTVEIYAFGNWTMWDGVYPETNAEGHEFEFVSDGVPWGKLYGGIGSSYGQSIEMFPVGEKTSFTVTKSGILSLYPYIGNYVSVKTGNIDIYIIGGTEASEDDVKTIDEFVKNDSQSLVLERLNNYRKSNKLPEIQIDPLLSQTAFDHAKYLALNNSFEREEESGKDNFTGTTFEDRLKKAGYEGKAREMFCQIDSPVESVDLLFDTIYHRLRLLDPDLRYIGYGNFKVQDNTIHVFDFGYANENDTQANWDVVVYPSPGSKDNKLEWNGFENPDPLPSGTVKPLGYPITIYFKDQINNVISVELLNNKKESIDSFIITPDTDINNKQINSIVIVPKKILSPSTLYTINVKVKIGNSESDKSYKWTFTTGK